MRTAMKSRIVIGLAAACIAPALACAQAYPQKPIPFMFPFPAAGAGDIFARTVAQKLSAALGQQREKLFL